MNDKQFRAYSLWLKVHPRYYDRYGYEAWKRFNSFFYDLYDIPYDYHDTWRKQVQNIKARRARINKYVRELVESCPCYYSPYLLTLTFSDDCLFSTNSATRLRYVKQYVKDTFPDYIGCIDFGKKNGREHYHFIVSLDINDRWDEIHVSRKGVPYIRVRDKPLWSYGFMSLCPIGVNLRSAASYAFKASNYAFKSADSDNKVFHARRALHWLPLIDDFDLIEESDLLDECELL